MGIVLTFPCRVPVTDQSCGSSKHWLDKAVSLLGLLAWHA